MPHDGYVDIKGPFCTNRNTAIHSYSKLYTYERSQRLRVVGKLEPIPAHLEFKTGYTLDSTPIHRTATNENINIIFYFY